MSITILLIITTVIISYLSFNNSSLREILIFSPYQYINNKKWWLVDGSCLGLAPDNHMTLEHRFESTLAALNSAEPANKKMRLS